MAEEKLEALLPPSPDTLLAENLEKLCLRLETHLLSEEWENGHAVLSEVMDAWKALDPDETHPIINRRDRLRNRIEEKFKSHEKMEQELVTLRTLCEQVEHLAHSPSDDAERQLNEIKDTWNQFNTSLIPASMFAQLEKRYHR